MKHFYNYLKGIAIGIANVIPGVSGGTMAFILGIYYNLTEAIGNFVTNKSQRINYTIFLITIGLGGFTGIILFAKFFSFMLKDSVLAQYTYGFFIGLIIGSIPFIISLHNDMKPDFKRIGVMVFAIALVLITSTFGTETKPADEYLITGELFGFMKLNEISFGYGIWLFVCGILGAGSMVLPGFSGSALLISLGEYSNILYFVDNRMVLPVAVVALGAIPGVVIFAKVISYFLKKFPSETYYFIIGLLIASLYQIYTEIKGELIFESITVVISIISLSAGFFVSYLLSKIKRPEKFE